MNTEPLSEKMMQGAWGTSASETAPENQNPDWQQGLWAGLSDTEDRELHDDNHPITVEWERRGQPETDAPAFRNWKRGYWTGRFRQFDKVKP